MEEKLEKVVMFDDEHGNIESSLNYFLKFNLNKELKILDIGCRYGSLLFNLYNIGYNDIYGVDIDCESIARGKERYEVIANRLFVHPKNKLNFQDDFFDVVLMFDVIEHIPNIQEYLINNAFRVLKNNGILFFQTPNKLINIPWEIINHKSFSKYKIGHCSLQSYFGLLRLLKTSKFKQIIIEKHNIITKHNKLKVKTKLGLFGIVLLYISAMLPLIFYPNFWGYGKK